MSTRNLRVFAVCTLLIVGFGLLAARPLQAADPTPEEGEKQIRSRMWVLTTRGQEIRDKTEKLNELSKQTQDLTDRAVPSSRPSIVAALASEEKFQQVIFEFHHDVKNQDLLLERTDGEITILEKKGLATAYVIHVKPDLRKMKIDLEKAKGAITDAIEESDQIRDKLGEVSGAEVVNILRDDYLNGKAVGLVEISSWGPQGEVRPGAPQDGFFTILNLDRTIDRWAWVVVKYRGEDGYVTIHEPAHVGWMKIKKGEKLRVEFTVAVTKENAVFEYMTFFVEGDGKNAPDVEAYLKKLAR